MAVHVGGHSIGLDRDEAGTDLNFVSHAHTDHLSGIRRGKGAFASEITRELVAARGRRFENAAVPCGAVLLSAGHMLGSRQLYIDSDANGRSVVYTGDYQMQRSYAAEEIEVRRADVLIIDSTYPYQSVTFDDRSEVISAIQCYSAQKAERGIVLFGAYSMGKAQELIRILNEAGIAPVVDEAIARINRVYESHNVRLDYEVADRLAQGGGGGNFVGIVNASRLKETKLEVEREARRRVFTAVATGFAKLFTFDTDVQFALSDHADFKQAVEYISICEPKEIYTVGSQAGRFARSLQSAGYTASQLSKGAMTEQIVSSTASLG